MKYSTWNEINNIEKKNTIWACAFDYDVEKQRFSLRQEPVIGLIVKNKFHQLKKDGYSLRANGVDVYSRVYADTKAECDELFVELMNKKISYLQDCIEMINKEKRDYKI
ncbi:hypothetical protein [Lacrimispora amygdalina]|uniref:hypothetical protein n=1 Tax=Lacrimispora amygdalina TaxID=253257 RepID=UPI000BE3B941|nr:hypothetical protein [Lacrimispora amygdalina]